MTWQHLRVPYLRYVALGDSSTEGLDDPDGAGGFRGWADRFAEHVHASSPDLAYANLAVRGKLVGEVLREQLGPGLALQPDLATVFAGVNDLLRPDHRADRVIADLEQLLDALVRSGATTLTITSPDPSRVMSVARPLRARLADHNERVRAAAARTGALLADVGAASEVGTDPRMWSPDRLHAGPLGHERIAAALAEALGLPGADGSWRTALPGRTVASPTRRAREEARWWQQHFGPWLLRRARGRSMGDGVLAKRPQLQPVRPAGGSGEIVREPQP